ncbi:MAG TPA: hypothetical protein VGL93_28205 [Streptosporangiaceae bacterium]
MNRLWSRIADHADGVLALVLALVVSILDLANDIIPANLVNNAILLCLAVLAFAVLRDRWRRESAEREVRTALEGASRSLRGLPERLDNLVAIEELVSTTRRALDASAAVRTVAGSEVGHALEEARRSTDRWTFKGGTGTYMRAVTLPECVANAKRERRALLVRLEILDPSDPDVCERYGRFRDTVSSKPDITGEDWTTERVRKESYATVLAACWYRQQYSLLDVDIGLSSVMTRFRWDLSDRYVVMTQEDDRGSALIFDSGKFYYDCWSTELQLSREQSRRVPIELAMDVPMSGEPTPEEVRRLFMVLGLPLPEGFTDTDTKSIIQKALNPKNPYG